MLLIKKLEGKLLIVVIKFNNLNSGKFSEQLRFNKQHD